MGTWFTFTCEKCGYSAEVSGGKDRGMHAFVQTMICRDCSELVDVLIEDDYPVRFENYTTGFSWLDETLGMCPKCSGKQVTPWDDDRPCPKCDGGMSKGIPTAIWD